MFRDTGVLFPVPVMPGDEIARYYALLCTLENERAGRLPPLLNFKPYLLVPQLWDLIHDPRILDPVSDLIGHDILCWEASFFSKLPGDGAHVTWHQDATYWGLSENEGVTAWLAFTPSNRGNGCMRIVPGSHSKSVAHVETPDRKNMLPLREGVDVPIDENAVVDVELAPGEMSLHHPVLIHGSAPNTSGDRRVGFAIRYIAGHVRQHGQERGSAVLVRGKPHDGFDLEQAPEGLLDPAARARHSILLRRWMAIVAAQVKAAPLDSVAPDETR